MAIRLKWQIAGVAVLVAAAALLYSERQRGAVETLGGPVAVRAPATPTPGPAMGPTTGATAGPTTEPARGQSTVPATPTTGPADPAAAEVTIARTPWEVADYEGIGLPSAPLDLRGCFRFPGALPEGPAAPAPRPPSGPAWFDCFDGPRIAADLASGAARAVLAAPVEMPGADRLIAVYPDGTAFQWRQPAE